MLRWLLFAALVSTAVHPLAAQSPVASVQIYTDVHPEGLDSAVMDRPTWGLICGRITRENGQVDTKTAVVAIESPLCAKLGATKMIADVGGRPDTVAVVVRNGPARVKLDSARYSVISSDTKRVCAWMVTTTAAELPAPGEFGVG